MDFREEFYKDYVGFKDWENESEINPDELFTIELARTGLSGNLKILEIGFGKGEFLDWAKEKGHNVCGLEIIPELVIRAKSKGFDVKELSALALTAETFGSARFDLIVILDVLEHLTVDEILKLLKTCNQLLEKNGRLLARFPNGLSPMGQVQQIKDITHITLLSPERMNQIGRRTGFSVHFSGNSARAMSQGRKPRWIRWILYKIRDLIQIVVGLLYYGGPAPLDPNMSVVLKKIDG